MSGRTPGSYMMATLNLQQTACEDATHGRVAVRCDHRQIVIQRWHHDLTNVALKFIVGTRNVVTMRGSSGNSD